VKARENPFASCRIERLAYRFDGGLTIEDMVARLRANRFRGAIVGPHGSGKTTLLEQLAAPLAAAGFAPCWWRFDEASAPSHFSEMVGAVRRLGKCELALIDGAEQIPWPMWSVLRWISRGAGGLVITTHRAGRLPTIWRCGTSPELLEVLVLELCRENRLCAGPLDIEVNRLWRSHRGNLREALRELYDRSAEGMQRHGQ
jgi:hypothetical protein